MKKIICLIILLLSLFYLYARYIGVTGLEVKETFIENEKISENYSGFKIIQFSDLLFDKRVSEENLNNIKDTINKYTPDIIVFTGDLINSTYEPNNEEKEMLNNFLKNIKANIYKLAIIGDNDKQKLDLYKNLMEQSNFILLDNKTINVFKNDTNSLEFTGINSFDKTEIIREENVTSIFNILLIHQPDEVNNLDLTNVDLVLAGHSLGGLIKFPFVGPIIKNEGAKIYTSGYYKINNTSLYVSNGLGTEKYKLRAFNKPEINLYLLKSK